MNRAGRRAAVAIARAGMRNPWTPWEERRASAEAARENHNLPSLRTAFVNNVYSVQVYDAPSGVGWDSVFRGVVRLAVRRHDSEPIRSWPDLQRIKDELCGPERVAIEVYPARSELCDAANMYHLWVLAEGNRLPFVLR